MGKGGTKFEGDAIGVRGKKFKSYTVKDRKKDLEEYQKTGVHPGIEAERRRAEAEALLALPDSDASRPRTYIEIAVDRTVIGKVVFEVFQDVTPLPARTFVNRCRPGTTATLQGSQVHKVLSGLGIYFGRTSMYKGEAAKLRNSSGLRHVDPHQVSISPDGTEIVISLCRSATLDASYLVVGRVQLGQEVLQKILDLGTNAHDEPGARVTVSACGMTNHKGVIETGTEAEVAAQLKQETPEETAARLAREASAAKDSIRDALQTALKRKEPDGGAAAAAAPAAKMARSHFDVLGGSSSSSSDGSQSDES